MDGCGEKLIEGKVGNYWCCFSSDGYCFFGCFSLPPGGGRGVLSPFLSHSFITSTCRNSSCKLSGNSRFKRSNKWTVRNCRSLFVFSGSGVLYSARLSLLTSLSFFCFFLSLLLFSRLVHRVQKSSAAISAHQEDYEVGWRCEGKSHSCHGEMSTISTLGC